VPLLLHLAPKPAPTPTPSPTFAPSALQPAITKAINFFEEPREPNDPYALLMLDVAYRRFGIVAFADALKRYDQMLTTLPDKAPLMRLFRRISDHDNPLQAWDLQEVKEDLDRVTILALYCDQLGLSDAGYQSMLEQAMSLGDYMLTHALLACIWIQENGCKVPLPDGFIENMYQANAALINDDSVVDDLELEAATFLYFAGQGTLVDHGFIDRVIAAQNSDGGWSLSSVTLGDSDWHASVLGLLLLLHVKNPSDSYPPMLAPASS
jgi:hypothetical protein